jgi:hypothetical protein
MVFSIGISLLLLVVANIYLFKYLMLKWKIDLVNNIDFEEIRKSMLEEMKDVSPINYDHAMDLRGTPTHACPCGCKIWNLKVIFDDFEIATYFLDMECASCGSLATAPTPIDREIK